MTGMGTANEQMAVRAQRALMCQMTSHLEAHCKGDQDQQISQPKGGQPASFALTNQVLVFVFIFAVRSHARLHSRRTPPHSLRDDGV